MLTDYKRLEIYSFFFLNKKQQDPELEEHQTRNIKIVEYFVLFHLNGILLSRVLVTAVLQLFRALGKVHVRLVIVVVLDVFQVNDHV